ncbi:MAG: hypothetical protein ABI140_12235 [Jatrophihabitantaceae bacterium]
MARVAETRIVDRDDETSLLAALLSADDIRRVMAVSDKPGMGKTDVLRKLRFVCETIHDVPVAMVRFDDFVSKPDVFSIAQQLYETLRDFGASFPSFEALNTARAFADVSRFAEQLRTIYGQADVAGATISGGQVAGTIFNVDAPNAANVSIGAPQWTDRAEEQAKALSVEAFVTDLLAYARAHPVVLLFDTVEKAADDLQRWLIVNLIRRQVLNEVSGHRLIVVLAGRQLLDTLEGRLGQSYFEHIACIDPGASVRKWAQDAVRAFLSANDYTGLSDDQIAAIQSFLASGGSLVVAILMAASYQSNRAASDG